MPAVNNESDVPAIEFITAARVYAESSEPVYALRGVNISVYRGELVAIMGPSGSGKTTLLNLAGGLDRPSEGDVLIDGVSLARASSTDTAKIRRRTVGYVFQNYNLISTLSALENVALPLELDGMATREARAGAHKALASIGIDDLAPRFPSDLSGGQAQRVSIARSLVGTRDIVLADEPTGALDSRTSDAVIQVLRDRADEGAAVVLVTHEARLAAWADRVIYLKDGMIVDDSGSIITPKESGVSTHSMATGVTSDTNRATGVTNNLSCGSHQ